MLIQKSHQKKVDETNKENINENEIDGNDDEVICFRQDVTYHPSQKTTNEPRRERISRVVKSEMLAKMYNK